VTGKFVVFASEHCIDVDASASLTSTAALLTSTAMEPLIARNRSCSFSEDYSALAAHFKIIPKFHNRFLGLFLGFFYLLKKANLYC
jgi:hypothetical protein